MESELNRKTPIGLISRSLRFICLAGLTVTILTMAGMTLTLVTPALRPEWFWMRLFWMGILAAIFWGSIYGYLWSALGGRAVPKGMGGIVPSISILSFWYSVISLLLMVLQMFFSENEWFGRVHLAVQIGLFGVVIVIILFMIIPLLLRNEHSP